MPKEILLVSPPYPPEGRRAIPPLGITSIASYLEENGYRGRIELADGFHLAKKHGYRESLERIKEKIKREKPLVVGCSVLYTNEEEATEIIEAAKEAGSYIIIGNHGATTAHEPYSKQVTAVVRGEGEFTTKELVDALFNNRELYGIKGLTFYDRGRVNVNPDRELVDLNELPPPAHHLLPSAKEYDPFSIEESRGCCFKCSFCSIAEMYQTYRLKSPKKIGLEVENIVGLGVTNIDLIGELVLLHEDRALGIADVMEEHGCSWKIDSHPALVVKHRKLLPLLAEKGLKVIEIGVESGNQRSLDLLNKQTTPEINEEAVEATLTTGIFPLIDFINFEPYLTMKDLEENIRFIMHHLRLLSKAPSYPLENIFKPWIPIPGTPLFDMANSENLVVSTDRADTTSYLKMKNARHFFIFKNEKVERVTDLIDYFLKRYGERYSRVLEQVVEDESIFSESPKAVALAVVPAYILCMAYAVVKNDIPGEVIIDRYCQQRLDAIEKGDYEDRLFSLPIPAATWGRIMETLKNLASSTS